MNDWIEDQIHNWVRWNDSARRWYRKRCRSIEHRYRSPQPWDAPPAKALGKVDELAAKSVEDAWKTLPFVPKMVLKYWYVERWHARRIVRFFHARGRKEVDARHWDIELGRARLLLSQALAIPNERVLNQGSVEFSAHRVPLGGTVAA